MAKNPSVSVIVPMYKVERYIKICIDSILAQTFQDFEIIIVDDASPDNSYDVCQKLYGNNDKVRFVRHKKNLGPVARNSGIKIARGKYIYFVDSDDFILPNTLEKLYNTAEKNNAQVVHMSGWYELWQEEPEPILKKNLQLRSDRSKEGMLPSDMVQRVDQAWREYTVWSMLWLCFCRRDFLEKNRIELLPILSEDEIFSFAVIYYVERYYVMQDSLYVYRRHQNSIMSTRTVEHFLKGLNSAFVGSAYIKKFLDRTPKFDGYDKWCDGIMSMAFLRFTANFMLAHYNNLTVPPEINKATKIEFKKRFHEYEPFVRYLFHYYHIYYYQTRVLAQQNQKLQQQNKTLTEQTKALPDQSKTNTDQIKTLTEQNKTLINLNRSLVAQSMSIFNRLPIAENKIVFVNFNGKGYGCNPKYIAEEIIRQNLPYDLVWAMKNLAEPLPDKIRKVKYDTLDAAYEIATAKVIVTNTKFRLPFPGKKDGQLYIMTWHGGQSFKKVEKDAEDKLSPAYVAESKETSAITDLMMVCSQDQYEEFKRAFYYGGEILKCGLPRNDIFFRRDEKLIERVRKSLNVPAENKIAMYAPTFRDNPNVAAKNCRLDAKKLLAALTKRFGGSWTLIVRFHPNLSYADFAKALFAGENIINAMNYPDMQELILITDVLVSDYSSVIFDCMFTGKKVFIYAKDFDTYPKERGFRPTIYQLPYAINRTEDQLFACIENFDEATLAPKVKQFIDTVKPFDNGHASETVVARIKSFIEKNPPPKQ